MSRDSSHDLCILYESTSKLGEDEEFEMDLHMYVYVYNYKGPSVQIINVGLHIWVIMYVIIYS